MGGGQRLGKEGNERGMTANGYAVSFWGEENVWKLVVMPAQLRDFSK